MVEKFGKTKQLLLLDVHSEGRQAHQTWLLPSWSALYYCRPLRPAHKQTTH